MKLLFFTILLFLTSIRGFTQDIYSKLNNSTFRDYELFQQTINIDSFNAQLLNACIFFATNEIRIKKRRNPLLYNNALEASSMLHSNDMAKLDFFSHTNKKIKKRRDPNDRAREVGILNPHIAENIIEGFIIQYKSGMEVNTNEPGVFINPKTNLQLSSHTYLSLSDDLLRMWMNSEGHKKNILSKEAFELGCGVALYKMNDFNNMPTVKATQNFQWFELILLENK